MKFTKIITTSALAALALTTHTVSNANEIGIHFGKGTYIDVSGRDQGQNELYMQVYYNSEETDGRLCGSWYYCEEAKFASYGLGFGYNFADVIPNLDIYAGAGFGISILSSETYSSLDSSSGITYQVGASYGLGKIAKVPLNLSARYVSVPVWEGSDLAGNSIKEGGGPGVILGISLAY